MGDLVLKWDKPHEEKGKDTKLQPLWIGSVVLDEKFI